MKNKKLFAILTLVCFMFTLMPVAAFAAGTDLDASKSYMVMVSGDSTTLVDTTDDISYNITFNTVDGEAAKNGLTGFNADATGGYTGDNDMQLYIWAEENGAPSAKLNKPVVTNKTWAAATVESAKNMKNVYTMNKVEQDATVKLTFADSGEFVVKVGYGDKEEDTLSQIATFAYVDGKVSVLPSNVKPENNTMDVTDAFGTNVTGATATNYNTNGVNAELKSLTANNITREVTLTFKNAGKALAAGTTVNVKSDSGNLAVNPGTLTLNPLGQAKLYVSASLEGFYTIYATVNGTTFTIGVNCGNTQAAYIETVDEPENKIALYDDVEGQIAFKITDINGNAVTNLTYNTDAKTNNATGANGLCFDGTATKARAQYLQFIEKPAASNLQNSDLELVMPDANADGVYYLTVGTKAMNAEGKYTVKAILDNGAVATASWEVKAFETPVELVIDAPSTVELGTGFGADLYYLDANGVEKDALDAKVAATGYAIYSFNENAVNTVNDVIKVKTDEKYAGSVITLTAASEMYDLVDVEEVKVAAEAVAIEFETDALEVDVNNKVEWNVVDEEGNEVTLTNVDSATIKYVVLDKPADAKVSVYDLTDDKTAFDGDGKMAITSNKVGNVTVQVIAQVKVAQPVVDKYVPVVDAQGNVTNNYLPVAGDAAVQTNFYSGTEIFADGTADKGDVVVMSIGSTEIVKNDKVSDMGVAPIVENGRTFVPYRAGLEAFGATVAYDEATQAVTAELNGVTVVMTIGSAEYTVNGEAKTADVAPFINGSRTMVPVRFVAEAFGIKVIPTYDENGATADILFNL